MKVKRSLKTFAALALVGGLVAPFTAQAHDAFLIEVHGAQTILYGHGISGSEKYEPKKVQQAVGLKNGKIQNLKIARHKTYATVEDGKSNVIGVMFDNGFWSKNAAGKWINKPKTQVPGATTSGRYVKYAVSYLNNREQARPLGLDFELVPLTNPAKLKKGESVTVQVLYKGRPLAGASVRPSAFSKDFSVKTDSQGKAVLNILSDGLNVFKASYKAPMQDTAQADTIGLSATLGFETKHDGHHH